MPNMQQSGILILPNLYWITQVEDKAHDLGSSKTGSKMILE